MAKTKKVTKPWDFIGYEIPSRRVADKLQKVTEGNSIDKNLIRQITGSHDILEVNNFLRTITFWKINGINCISSDSCFQLIEETVNGKGQLSEEYLQNKTGYLLPIHINTENHIINF